MFFSSFTHKLLCLPHSRDKNETLILVVCITALCYIQRAHFPSCVFKLTFSGTWSEQRTPRLDFSHFYSKVRGLRNMHRVDLAQHGTFILCGANVRWCNCSWETRGCLSSAGMSCVRPRLCVAQCGSAVSIQPPRARCSLPE